MLTNTYPHMWLHQLVNLPTYTNPYHQIFYPLQVCSLRFVWRTLKHGKGALCNPSGGYHANWRAHQFQSIVCGCEWNVNACSDSHYMWDWLGTYHFQHCIHTYNVMCGHVLKSIHTHTCSLEHCSVFTTLLYGASTYSTSISDYVFLDSHCISRDVH